MARTKWKTLLTKSNHTWVRTLPKELHGIFMEQLSSKESLTSCKSSFLQITKIGKERFRLRRFKIYSGNRGFKAQFSVSS